MPRVDDVAELRAVKTAFERLNRAIANSHEDGNVERAALMRFREDVRDVLDGCGRARPEAPATMTEDQIEWRLGGEIERLMKLGRSGTDIWQDIAGLARELLAKPMPSVEVESAQRLALAARVLAAPPAQPEPEEKECGFLMSKAMGVHCLLPRDHAGGHAAYLPPAPAPAEVATPARMAVSEEDLLRAEMDGRPVPPAPPKPAGDAGEVGAAWAVYEEKLANLLLVLGCSRDGATPDMDCAVRAYGDARVAAARRADREEIVALKREVQRLNEELAGAHACARAAEKGTP